MNSIILALAVLVSSAVAAPSVYHSGAGFAPAASVPVAHYAAPAVVRHVAPAVNYVAPAATYVRPAIVTHHYTAPVTVTHRYVQSASIPVANYAPAASYRVSHYAAPAVGYLAPAATYIRSAVYPAVPWKK